MRTNFYTLCLFALCLWGNMAVRAAVPTAISAAVPVDTLGLQCSQDYILRGDTIATTLHALEVACQQIELDSGFTIEGEASYTGWVTNGSASARQAATDAGKGLSVPSPTAASLGKYVDIPVNYNNGLPQINIPIATVKEGELQLPISLQYHPSGIKVEELASWVGLNWSLSAGGVINRQVMGGPDESYLGGWTQKGSVPLTTFYNQLTGYYSHRGFRAFLPFIQCNPPATPLNQVLRLGDEFLGAGLGIKDTEPDLFNFNVAGYTGKFYFDSSRVVHLIPQQDVQIEVDFDSLDYQFNRWRLITPDGTRYHFGENNAFEKSRTGAGSNAYPLSVAELRSSWYLTRVESGDRKRNIYLEYTSEETAYRSLAPEKFMTGSGVPYAGPSTPDQRINTTRVFGKRLNRIYGSSTEVIFKADSLRQDVDISGTAKRLDEIQVKARTSSSCLNYKLSYDYMVSSLPASGDGDAVISTDANYDDLKRLRLLSVQEFSCDYILNKPAYQFTYAGGVLPRRLSYQRDHWGYFNGKTSNNTQIPDGTTSMSGSLHGDRDPDVNYTQRGHLYQIIYPTGGFIHFTMEANTNSGITKGGLRVSQIAEYFSATDSVVRTFQYISTPVEPFPHLYSKSLIAVTPWTEFVGSGCALTSGTFKSFSGNCYVGKSLIGSNLFGEIASLTGQAVSYAQVRVNYSNSGYTLYKYLVGQYTGLFSQINSFPVVADNALYYVANGTLEAEEHYNQSGQIQQKTVYSYNNPDPVTVASAPALKFGIEICPPCPGGSTCDLTTTLAFQRYTRQTIRQLLLKKTQYFYNLDGTGELRDTTIYTYGPQHEQPIRTARKNSKGDSLISETRFVRDLITSNTGTYTGDAYPLFLMRQRNMNAPVEQLTFIKKVGQTESQKKAIAGSYTKFGVITSDANHLKPVTQYSLKVPDPISVTPVSVSGGVLTYDSQYEPRLQMTYYATSGLLESEKAEKGATIYYTYGSNLLLASRIDAYGTGLAQTTAYSYDELFGPVQMTNPRGLITRFEYDGLGRLVHVKDHENKIVKGYDYQYFANPALPVNWVSELTPRVAGTSLPTGFANLQTVIGYVDGLGRSLQNVGKEAGPGGSNDIVVSAQTYDATGRAKRSYIPFTNVGSGSLAALPGTVHGDSAPYSENSLFDDSPLKRVTKAYGPGQAWRTADKAVLMSYGTAGSEVRQYEVTGSGASSAGNYAGAVLLKKTVTNERGLNTVEFTDKNGQVVERWTPDTTGGNYFVTSYVYDDLGRLRYVLPPKAQPGLTTFTEVSGDFAEGLYGYKYDHRGRVTEKHIPGADWEHIVYDVLDRPVIRQNARQRTDSLWSFTKYDALGRVVQTGETTNNASRSTLQGQFDGITTPYETVVGGNQSFPITPLTDEYQTQTYYDDYIPLPSGYTYSGGYISPHSSAVGLATGSRVRNPIDNSWLYSATYYDTKDRVVQLHQQNHVGAINKVDLDYTFAGEITKQRSTNRRTGSADLVILHEYEYDHVGRKTAFFYTYDTLSRKQFARYEYDQVGRLKTKILQPATAASAAHITRTATPPANTEDVASESVTLLPDFSVIPSAGQPYIARISPFAGLQSIDYRYHIRNYLLGINLDGSGNPSLAEGRLFAMKLGYEADGTYYDGNIRKQTWLAAHDSLSRSYTYTYDLANRLTSAAFAGGQTGENYSLETVSYDKNGNLHLLKRRGKTGSSSFGYVDQLTYTYAGSNSNKISEVNDAIANAGDVEMFKDVSGTDYTYWENGALKSDNNKGISQIQYNHLELTKRIEFTSGKWIDYYFDGAGNKLRKVTSDSLQIDYVGAIIYQNDTLYQVAHDEGRYSAMLGFEFSYTDHLGNVRLMFRDSSGVPAITQTENFGAWGESLKSLNYYRGATGKEQFVFTGHERDEDLGLYDAKARMYDPLVPRFWSIDPLADHANQMDKSPYAYAWNNPVNLTDPDGRCPSCPQGEEAAQIYAKGATVTNKDGSWTWTGSQWQTNQTTQVSERTAASAMPVNMAFGMGAYAGLQQTGQFISSLTTAQGWKDLGQGFVNMARMGNPADPDGIMMRAEMAMAVDAYAENIPDMTAGEVAYDLGYASEKVGEAVLTRKVIPVSKASLGLRRGLGDAARNTNMISYGLKGRLGKLPFSVPTLMPKIGSRTSDVGIMLSRNFITPFGYGIGVGQFQYVQKRK